MTDAGLSCHAWTAVRRGSLTLICPSFTPIVGLMDISQGIREAVPLIVQNFRTNENSQIFLRDLVNEVSAPKLKVERLYLAYNLMQVLSRLSEAEIVTFFAKVLPVPLSPNASLFIEHMVSLSVSVEQKDILTATAGYLQQEAIRFPPDLESLPDDLALQSPRFVAVVISRGCFIDSPHVFSPQMMAQWLNHLSVCEADVTIDAQRIIEYSLIGHGSDHKPLHLSILKCMQMNKVHSIPGQFFVTTGRLVTEHTGAGAADIRDRFSQILLVSLESKLLPKITSPMRKQLMDLFSDNEFITLLLNAVK